MSRVDRQPALPLGEAYAQHPSGSLHGRRSATASGRRVPTTGVDDDSGMCTAPVDGPVSRRHAEARRGPAGSGRGRTARPRGRSAREIGLIVVIGGVDRVDNDHRCWSCPRCPCVVSGDDGVDDDSGHVDARWRSPAVHEGSGHCPPEMTSSPQLSTGPGDNHEVSRLVTGFPQRRSACERGSVIHIWGQPWGWMRFEGFLLLLGIPRAGASRPVETRSRPGRGPVLIPPRPLTRRAGGPAVRRARRAAGRPCRRPAARNTCRAAYMPSGIHAVSAVA